MTFIMLSKTRCLPCRQAHKMIQHLELDWPTKWYHDDPTFFKKLGIVSVPALIKVVGSNEYSIEAIGLPEIKNYITNMNTNRDEEE